MVSTFSSGSTLPPTKFRNMFDQDKYQDGLTFIDFLPEVREPGGFFSKAIYDTFRLLVDRANNWLKANPQFEIKTCESVEFKDKGSVIDAEKMTYLEYGEISTSYIRGLRLWIVRKTSEDETSQQIGYVNMTPLKKQDRGWFSAPVYEDLEEVIDRYNTMARTQQISGRIITVESQEMKTDFSGDLDPDKSNWVEKGKSEKHFLFIIRIFFEISEALAEEIGIKDFEPEMVEKGGVFGFPKFEFFSNTVTRASEWCSQQEDVRICNAQSLEIKCARGSDVDTLKMNYHENGSVATLYVRILRIAYVKSPANYKPQPIAHLTCKSFVPVQLTTGLFVPEFESLSETKERISAWMNATGARVISAETSAMRIFTGGEAKEGTEASLTFNQAERDEYWIFIVRAYINGMYKEPPEEMLPPIPDIDEQNCCTIC